MSQARPLTAEERSRLEAAQVRLARSAVWVAGVALVLPTVLSVVVTLSTLVSPLPWTEKLLALPLGYAAIFGVFTLSMLLNETGHTLASWRRIKRDAQDGYRLEREHGEVKWGKSSYVAVANGRRLLSPYFTDLESVPGFWRHFDRLAPGHYVFDLLPESGLVVRAERDDRPTADAATADAAVTPANASRSAARTAAQALDAALLAVFRNGEADLAVNRGGRASGAQRFRLVVSYSWVMILLPCFSVGGYLGAATLLHAPTAGDGLGVLVALAIGVFVLQLGVRVALDLVEGRVESKVGRTTFRFGKTDATGSIDGRSFTLSNTQARALFALPRYRVYFFRRTGRVTGAQSA